MKARKSSHTTRSHDPGKQLFKELHSEAQQQLVGGDSQPADFQTLNVPGGRTILLPGAIPVSITTGIPSLGIAPN